MSKLLVKDSWVLRYPSGFYVFAYGSDVVTPDVKRAERMTEQQARLRAKMSVSCGCAVVAVPYVKDRYDKYTHLCGLAMAKYADGNGHVTVSRAGFPSRFKLVTDYLYRRFILQTRLPKGFREIVY